MSAVKEVSKDERGYSQVMRVFAAIEAIAPSSNGLPIEEIHKEVIRITGEQWNRRTILRDMSFLISKGYCSVIKNKRLRLYVVNRQTGAFPTYLFPL